MFFVLLSIIFMLITVYCSYVADKNNYILPTLVFEPKNKKWLYSVSFVIIITLLIIMAILYFLANQPSLFPNWLSLAVWLIDAGCSVYLIDVWLKAVHSSSREGNKFYGKYNYKQSASRFRHQLRHLNQKRHK